MNRPIRIAALSFDHGHQYSYLRVMMGLPDLQLVAIADPDPEQRAQAARVLDVVPNDVRVHARYEEVLAAEDIDAVSICTANALHHDVVLAAAESGKHVLCEKPLATNVGDATSMVRGCADYGVILATAYPVRHAAQVWDVRQRLASDELGAIRVMSMTNVLQANVKEQQLYHLIRIWSMTSSY